MSRLSLRSKARLLRTATVLVPLTLAVTLGGCSTRSAVGTHGGAMVTSQAETLTPAQLNAALAYWQPRYEANREDKDAALNYSTALRASGRAEQAVAVLRRAIVHHEGDRDLLAAYGKALVANGSFEEALRVIDRAHRPDAPDWRLYSAKGTILDQIGRHDDARREYSRALAIVPNEPTVMSNIGLSYALTGDLVQAERILRDATAVPDADSRVRANLALVVGLQGRFEEAETIASRDLPPEQAAENMAYLRSMLSQDDRWQQLSQLDNRRAG